jgi:uncharacterized protein DUF3383
MSLDTLVQVNISVEAVAPTQANFGIALLLAFHTKWLDLTREYAEPAELLDDGFLVTDPAYLMATAYASQNPHQPTFKIGRRKTGFQQIFTLTPINLTANFTYKFRIKGPGATVWTDVLYQNDGTPTLAEACTGIAADIDPMANVAATSDGTKVTVTVGTAGSGMLVDIDFESMDPQSDLVLRETTADPGLAADLNAIIAVDPDWYGLALDSNSPNEITAVAAWIEAQKKIYRFSSMEGEIVDSGQTSDLASDLVAAAYTRTWGLYKESFPMQYPAVSWLARSLVLNPGSYTEAYMTLPGITADVLRPAHFNTIHNKNTSTYTSIGGQNVTFEGKTPAGEFGDIPRFIDWLHARIQEAVFAVLASNDKVPYTDAGVEMVAGAVRAVLRQGVQVGGLRADPAPLVTAPLVADIDIADRANRLLPDINFSAELAGAIHRVVIRGKVTV